MAAAGFTARKWADMVDDDDSQDCFPMSANAFPMIDDDVSRDGVAIPKHSSLFDLAVEHSNDGVNLALKKIGIAKDAPGASVFMTSFPPLTATKQASSSTVQLKEIDESGDSVVIKTAPAPDATTPTRSAAKRSYFSALTGRSPSQLPTSSTQNSAQKMEPAAKKEKVDPAPAPVPAAPATEAPSKPEVAPTPAAQEETEEDKRVRRALRFGGNVPMPKLSAKLQKETDPTRLRQRQKQIDLGKNTIGYQNYVKAVPKNKRRRTDPNTPNTPDKTRVMPKRRWDQEVRAWRRALHEYDPPKPEGAAADESMDTMGDSGSEESSEPAGPVLPAWRDVEPAPAQQPAQEPAQPAPAEPAAASSSPAPADASSPDPDAAADAPPAPAADTSAPAAAPASSSAEASEGQAKA
eukprot:tig00001073_g6823.t1